MTEKPHKGRIEQWEKVTYTFPEEPARTLVWGLFVDHPEWMENSYGHTSYIVAQDGNEIETRNSRYTLGEPYDEEHS